MLIYRLILMLAQLALAFWATPFVARYAPKLGQLDIFVYAVVVAIIDRKSVV